MCSSTSAHFLIYHKLYFTIIFKGIKIFKQNRIISSNSHTMKNYIYFDSKYLGYVKENTPQTSHGKKINFSSFIILIFFRIAVFIKGLF